MGVKDRGASNRNGWLFVSWQMCNGRFVEASTGVYVDRVDDIIRGFGSVGGV